MLLRAILLDRDGVINAKASEGEYITTLSNQLLPGAVEAIAGLFRSGFEIFIVTNQRGLARRQVSPAEIDRMHAALIAAVERAGGRIRQIYVCPHDDSDHCDCRKPKPGLLLQAMREHRIDPAASWMIGDSPTDMLAGRAAGCRTLYLGARPSNVPADASADSLEKATDTIQRESDLHPATALPSLKRPGNT